MNIFIKSWCWNKKGEPTDLVLEDIKLRPLKSHEVLVKNTIIGLNPVDWKLIEWGYPGWGQHFVPGVDAAGTIAAVGDQAKHLRIGARVCYHTDLSQNGTFSSHTIVPARALMAIPDHVSDEAAASFPCPGLTALQALQKVPDLQGKNVLVSGAGGSVGYFLVQLLLQTKAHVYVTASPQHHEHFLELGVIGAVDYKAPDWPATVTNMLHDSRFDAVFDTVSGTHATSLASLLGYYGHLISIQDRVEQNPIPAFTTCISLHEIALGAFHQYATNQQIAQLMHHGEQSLQQIGNGLLKLRPHNIGRFDELPAHLATMKQLHQHTKYLISVGP